jgi:hypothetical protein
MSTHKMTDPEVQPRKPLEEVLWHTFEYFYHLDKGNACIHVSVVRFSPITFRLAEHLWSDFRSMRVNEMLREVILDSGQYEEDKGR